MGEKTTNSEPLMQQQPIAVPQEQQFQQQQQPSNYSGPGAIQQSTWSNSIWDCFSPGELCLKTTFCPCFVYGKTQHRLNQDANLMGYERFNNDCLLWAGAQCCGLGPVFTFLQRRQIREKFAIGGESDVTDIALSWCCHCCAVMQHEKEVVARNQSQSGGINQQGYQRSEPMVVA
ncbi:hypothetical protein SBOR_2354 [Sclerotinia borealis F-4128]|uniref:PLAC8 family protein n=1 Tax=Sclerotinia borealis (strain F-4128) TaxID=1432307 RepID=W9CN04_SCLBF|nr:hypothetical protein SBOR_2354 [Sclerotinia borealis F-4128]